jgi:hypothetical protein
MFFSYLLGEVSENAGFFNQRTRNLFVFPTITHEIQNLLHVCFEFEPTFSEYTFENATP